MVGLNNHNKNYAFKKPQYFLNCLIKIYGDDNYNNNNNNNYNYNYND